MNVNRGTGGFSPRKGVDNQRVIAAPAQRITLPQGRVVSGGTSMRRPKIAPNRPQIQQGRRGGISPSSMPVQQPGQFSQLQQGRRGGISPSPMPRARQHPQMQRRNMPVQQPGQFSQLQRPRMGGFSARSAIRPGANSIARRVNFSRGLAGSTGFRPRAGYSSGLAGSGTSFSSPYMSNNLQRQWGG